MIINLCKKERKSFLISSAKYAYRICDIGKDNLSILFFSYDETTTNTYDIFSYTIFGHLLPFQPWNMVLNATITKNK